MGSHAEFGGARGRERTRALVLTGVFAALGCAATLALQIPTPTGGYVNLEDTVVLLGAYLLGPAAGAAAGGIGPALADLLSGYAVYVPGTLVIKGAMGLLAAALYRRLGGRALGTALCALPAEALMVAGYFAYEAVCLGLGMGAAASVPANMGQGLFGAAAGVALYLALRKLPAPLLRQ